MPLAEIYNGKMARKRLKCPCPFIDLFFLLLIPSHDDIMSNEQLYAAYENFIKSHLSYNDNWCADEIPDEMVVANISVFGNRLYAEHACLGINHCSTRPRGYRVKLKQNTTRASATTYHRTARSSSRLNQCRPLPLSADLFVPLYSGKKTGWGCYANQDLQTGVSLCEYQGQFVSKEEGHQRELVYRALGKPMTMVWIGELARGCLDAHRDPDGRHFEDHENPARLFNNRRHNPNCKLQRGPDGKFYLVTRRPVADGIELFWNYDDKITKDSPEWMKRTVRDIK